MIHNTCINNDLTITSFLVLQLTFTVGLVAFQISEENHFKFAK